MYFDTISSSTFLDLSRHGSTGKNMRQPSSFKNYCNETRNREIPCNKFKAQKEIPKRLHFSKTGLCEDDTERSLIKGRAIRQSTVYISSCLLLRPLSFCSATITNTAKTNVLKIFHLLFSVFHFALFKAY